MAADSAGGCGYASRSVLQVRDGHARWARDFLAVEVPVAVHYDGQPFAVMMMSPPDLEDFAYGFSLTERRLRPSEVVGVEVQELLEGILLDIRTRHPARPVGGTERLMPGRTGCGICGNRLLEDVVRRPAPVGPGLVVDAAVLDSALSALQERQPLNAATGATHAVAWVSAEGRLRLVREDVGRHNALDKLIGALLRSGSDTSAGFALTTSRASYEMVTKAALAGISVLAAISAPTALAVQLAQDCGLTLAGFVRPGRHVVYSHPGRVRGTGVE